MHRNRTIIPLLVLLLGARAANPTPSHLTVSGSDVMEQRSAFTGGRGRSTAGPTTVLVISSMPTSRCASTQIRSPRPALKKSWVNDTDGIDFIRGQCTKECVRSNAPDAVFAGLDPKCSDATDVWTVLNHEGLPTPDPGHAITDPWHLECFTPKNSHLNPKPYPANLTVIAPDTAPRWPSTSEYIELICDNFQDCSEEFVAPILGYLFYEDVNGDWGNDMGRADHLAMIGNDTASTLTLSIDNFDSEISSETNDVAGRIEYSAPACGEVECPLYVANMTLDNETDTWVLWSEFHAEYASVTDVRTRLRRPVLGIWNTTTNEVYIGEGMMELYIEATVSVGAGASELYSFFVANGTDVFGELGEDGAVAFLSLAANDGAMLSMEAHLDYGLLTDSPPSADIGLPPIVAAPTSSGLPISSIMDGSSDPDNDIETKLWIVDGQQRAYDYMIPTGLHMLILEVEDERGAFDVDGQNVNIVYP